MKMSVFVNTMFFNAFNDLLSKDLPIKTAYNLKKAQEILIKEEQEFNNMRKSIVEKYAVLNEDGEFQTNDRGGVEIQKDKTADFNKEFNDLLEIEFECPEIGIDDLGDINISVSSLNALGNLIK